MDTASPLVIALVGSTGGLAAVTTVLAALPKDAPAAVLSGNGHDGATGAAAVHGFGGTVIASDEATSEVFSMPDAAITRDHIVDFVLPLDQIPGRLVQLMRADG